MPYWRRTRAQNAFKFKYSYHYNPEEYVTTVWYFIEEVFKKWMLSQLLNKNPAKALSSHTEGVPLWCHASQVCYRSSGALPGPHTHTLSLTGSLSSSCIYFFLWIVRLFLCVYIFRKTCQRVDAHDDPVCVHSHSHACTNVYFAVIFYMCTVCIFCEKIIYS